MNGRPIDRCGRRLDGRPHDITSPAHRDSCRDATCPCEGIAAAAQAAAELRAETRAYRDDPDDAPCIAGEHYPNDAGTACYYCGLPAEIVAPDELAAAWSDLVAQNAAEDARDRWPAIIRAARADRDARSAAYRDMHPGRIPPADATFPDAGGYDDATGMIAPRIWHRDTAAQRQREAADLAASWVLRPWRHRDTYSATVARANAYHREHPAGPVPAELRELASDAYEVLTGRAMPFPEYVDMIYEPMFHATRATIATSPASAD